MNVRFNDPEWEKHAATFNALLGELGALIRRCEGKPFAVIEKNFPTTTLASESATIG